ncbi:MAG: hypothetical protein ACI8WB_002881 [Phenylobacterium sp.]|jgi:uncharacterized protein YecT (DUF1311 family)
MRKRLLMPFISLAIPACFMLLPSLAFAADGVKQCASSRDTAIDYLRCLDRKMNALESDLTLWGNSHIFALEAKSKVTGRRDTMHVFKKAQKSFVKYREHNCRWQYLSMIPDTSAGAIRYKECMIDMSQTRVESLKRLSK